MTEAMTENSKTGILEILAKLSKEELISLATTVSQGFLKNKIKEREDATQAIIQYSTDELSILRRKIVTRDLLFSYLHEKQVTIPLPITKNELVELIGDYWQLPKRARLTFASTSITNEENNGRSISTSTNLTTSDRTNIAASNSSELECRSSPSSTQNNLEVSSNEEASRNIYVMAQQFSEWFYNLLNQNAPLSTEHFYQDALLKLITVVNGQSNCEIVNNNPEEIVSVLFRTKMSHNLYFNPNISKEGIQGRMDQHGLVVILACGTLHVNNVCVGVFEQVFALARDPFADNNWKIKNTQLNLKSGSVSNPPCLQDSEFTSNLLSLPST